MKKAVAPLVANTNIDLTQVINIVSRRPISRAEAITGIFENPGLAPGGILGIGGSRLSRNDSAIARADITPTSEIRLFLSDFKFYIPPP